MRSSYKVNRYVDDRLIISTGEDLVCEDDLIWVFSDALAIEVTVEEPVERKIMFLDLRLSVGSSPLFWMYSTKSRNGYSPSISPIRNL